MSKAEAAKKKSTTSSTPTPTAAACATSHPTPSRIMDAIKSILSKLLPGSTNCQIHNTSESTIIMIPKSYLDGVDPPRGYVIDKLVREIPPNESIDVNSEAYNLNHLSCGVQMKIHFVPAEVPKDVSTKKKVPTVRLQQHNDAAYPNGVEVATVEEVLFHYELKDQKICLDCEEGGKVKKVPCPNKESTKTVPQDKK